MLPLCSGGALRTPQECGTADWLDKAPAFQASGVSHSLVPSWGRGQRPQEAGLAGWSFWLWADQIHRLPRCADHLQQHLGGFAQH